jgi:uncharacterized membrane protein YfcA
MASDDAHDEPLSASERRAAELLAILGTEVIATRTDLSATIARRLRGQRDSRMALIVGTGLLASVVAGMVGLFPPAVPRDER